MCFRVTYLRVHRTCQEAGLAEDANTGPHKTQRTDWHPVCPCIRQPVQCRCLPGSGAANLSAAAEQAGDKAVTGNIKPLAVAGESEAASQAATSNFNSFTMQQVNMNWVNEARWSPFSLPYGDDRVQAIIDCSCTPGHLPAEDTYLHHIQSQMICKASSSDVANDWQASSKANHPPRAS